MDKKKETKELGATLMTSLASSFGEALGKAMVDRANLRNHRYEQTNEDYEIFHAMHGDFEDYQVQIELLNEQMSSLSQAKQVSFLCDGDTVYFHSGEFDQKVMEACKELTIHKIKGKIFKLQSGYMSAVIDRNLSK